MAGSGGSEAGGGRKKGAMQIEGYSVEGLSIGGQETCVIFPTLKIAFDIGRCPQRAIAQEFLFISHGHMDHIKLVKFLDNVILTYRHWARLYIWERSIKNSVEKLFAVHREMDQSELKHTLIGLDVGEEFQFRRDLIVRPFRTYHVVPSQGYLIYSVKQKLKQEFIGLSGNEIKNMRLSGVEVTNIVRSPEIAFTGDTMADFIVDPENSDVLNAKILIMESTFLDNGIAVQHARDYGHTHLSEIVNYAERFHNKALLLIHFSARYTKDEIEASMSQLPSNLIGKVFTLTEGI